MNKRCANFTDYEKELLINIVMEYRHIIENKQTNATTWKEKNQAWEQIEKDFNGNGTVVRSGKTLKYKYENIKKEIRKVCGDQRRDALRTGGGAPQARHLLPFEEKVLAVSEMSATGMGPTYDSDLMNAEYLENDDMKMYMAALQKQKQKPIISSIEETNIKLNIQDIDPSTQTPENQIEPHVTDECLIEHNTAGPSDRTRTNTTI